MGGQTALNLSIELQKKILSKYTELIGATKSVIESENKSYLKSMTKIGLDSPTCC